MTLKTCVHRQAPKGEGRLFLLPKKSLGKFPSPFGEGGVAG